MLTDEKINSDVKLHYSDEQIADCLAAERAALGIEDHFFHCRNILGYSDMNERTHGELCRRLMEWPTRKKCLVGPRDCFKSSIDVIGMTTRLIAENPFVKILITSETQGQAGVYLSGIQNHLSANRTYRDTYRHIYDDYYFENWNSECINLLPKDAGRRVSSPENTVDIAGIGTSSVGMHYDYIFFVDPHSQNNIKTKEQVEKVIVYNKLLDSIAKKPMEGKPGGRTIIEMTRWSHFDLVDHIKRTVPDQYDFWEQSAYNADGSLFFPERLSQEELDKQLENLGTYLFSALYLARPQSDKDKIFKPEIAVYHRVEKKGLKKILLCDPSISEKEDADDFALVLIGADLESNRMYLLDWQRVQRKLPGQAVAQIIVMMDRHARNERWLIGMESNGFQVIYKHELERELSRHGASYDVVELKHGGRSKRARITALQPFYEQGKLQFRAGEEDRPSPDMDIVMQLSEFPFGSRDDLIDATAYALDILAPKREAPVVVRQMVRPGSFEAKVQAARSGKQTGFARRYS